VDESLADQEIHKSSVIMHNLWKIWRPAPSGTESYGRQVGRQAGRRAGRQAGKQMKFGRSMTF